MKVQIEGRAPGQAGRLDLLKPGSHEAQVGASVDPGAVGGQVGALGHHIETGKEGDALVKDPIHDMTFSFDAHQLQSQQGAHGLLGGNHLGAGKAGGLQHRPEIDRSHQRDEQKQTADPGAKATRGQIDLPHVGDGRGFGLEGGGAFLIPTPGKSGEALLPQQDR